jgi:hypothetical protein
MLDFKEIEKSLEVFFKIHENITEAAIELNIHTPTLICVLLEHITYTFKVHDRDVTVVFRPEHLITYNTIRNRILEVRKGFTLPYHG